METDVYQKLARFLDSLPPGYPATESGVELRILRKLFTPEEAELALQLNLLGEEPRVIAVRVKQPVEMVAQRLEVMAQKGLIYAIRQNGKPVKYQAVYFVLGIWELQVNRLTPELVQDVDEYFRYIFGNGIWETSAQLRIVPVMESIPVKHDILVYEQAEAIVQAQQDILLAPCICRREKKMVGEGCDKPMESCLLFGGAARHYYHNGLGRMIGAEEAVQVLKNAQEAGLVLQPTNSQAPIGLCCCCGDCCGVLRHLNMMEKPARVAVSAFHARHDPGLCAACGTCATRCQMHAVNEHNGVYSVNLDRCIGCGLCVTTCKTGAMTLVRKPPEERPAIPKSEVYTAFKMWRNRDRLDLPELLKMGVKSKMDRLLALGRN